jgi:CheY-like chemotaxis protein
MEGNIPEKFIGDQARLIQIATNLVSNMLAQTDEGMVDVHCSVVNPNWSTVMLKLVVSGTDLGKSVQLLEDLQKPVPENTKEGGYEGQQLSLAIAKRLIELQNGSLSVESRASQGTSFEVNLPFKNAAKVPTKENRPLSSYGHLQGYRVLIVEDNKVNQLVVANLLRKLGMEVSTADNGMLALEEFDKKAFDLVLMDVQMPVMDGYRATAEMRRHPDSNKNDVPIIALTSSAFLTAKEKAKLFGMNDHVGKPFSPEELLEKMSACLEFCKKLEP